VREILSARRHPGGTTGEHGSRTTSGSDLLLSIATVGRRCVLSAMGQADSSTAECMSSAFATVGQRPEREVWIDLTHLRSIDTRVAHELRELHSTVQRQRRRLVLICPPGTVARRLAIAGLDDASITFTDFASAHAATDRGPVQKNVGTVGTGLEQRAQLALH
jgi:anti-anti-sigma regulatory factor